MIILIISLIFFFFAWKKLSKAKKLTSLHADAIKYEEEHLQELKQAQEKIQKENSSLIASREKLIKSVKEEKEKTDKIHEEEKIRLLKLTREFQAAADAAQEQYFDNLEKYYQKQEKDFDNKLLQLQNNYDNEKAQYEKLFNQAVAQLNKIQATRDAAIAASLKEQEVKEKSSFYCLNVKSEDLNDIKILEEVKTRLRNPRILSMLIWSTYFQKDMTALCNRVLGLTTVIGIYKITNQKNGRCYIGQSVDVSKRWKEHAKCGLGIDTPAGNKLYKEMQEVGIWNFSWELLETCSRADLNEKERFYIDLYKSKDYGYNTVKGVN